MKLILDFGNTYQKVALFQKTNLVELKTFNNIGLGDLITFTQNKKDIKSAIISSVINYPGEIREFLKTKYLFFELDNNTPTPVLNKYQTPESLGKDRLAAIIAANKMFSGQNALVIDAGTCITYDIINSKNEYLGGGISPGISMRFKSLHNFTEKLPLQDSREDQNLIGQNTQESIFSGVLNGVLAEVDGIISQYQRNFSNLKIILSGGELKYFDKRLKNNIFAVPNIVIIGLNLILDFNVRK